MKVFEDKLTTIFNGDCVVELNNLEDKVDLILTSPPYNMTSRPGGTSDKSKRYDTYVDWLSEDEYLNWTKQCFDKFSDVLEDDGVILYNFSYSIENPGLPYKMVSKVLNETNFNLVDTIVWKKSCGLPFPANKYRLSRNWEYVFVFCKKGWENNFQIHKNVTSVSEKTNQKYYEVVYNFVEAKNNDGVNDLNKATFSTELVNKLLDVYSCDTTRVLDPFMGTGTTGVACRNRGMHFVGIELSSKQCEYSIERMVGSYK